MILTIQTKLNFIAVNLMCELNFLLLNSKQTISVNLIKDLDEFVTKKTDNQVM